MSKVVHTSADFIVVGENIHTTRSVRRDGIRMVKLSDGVEAVKYNDEQGLQSYLSVPESYKDSQPYQQGQIKHFMIAANKGIGDDEEERKQAERYVRAEAVRQIRAGANFLDLNVDEISYKLDIQIRAMEWIVGVVQNVSTVPLSIDSSNQDIIAAGLAACGDQTGRPMLNSVALERLDTIELVTRYKARTIVTAAGEASMPSDHKERVENVLKLVEELRTHDVPLTDVYVDGLVFPISVASDYGNHYLEAVAELRNQFGNQLHITGGLSNVSFGLPNRKLINDVFIHLSIEKGIDSGIVDPVQSDLNHILSLSLKSEPECLAADMLLGKDEYCVNYIKAWKEGRLTKS